jgi:F-type H+-transporting ATPase subunit b
VKFDPTTFAFEAINFLVLVYLLHRLVYRPLRTSIDERRAAIERQVRDAEAKRREAEALEREWRERLGEHERLRREALRQAAEDAGRERARLVEEAREEAAGERARVQRQLEAEREAELSWAREVAVERSTDLAGRLLGELAPDAVDAALHGLLAAEIERQAASLRDAARAGPGLVSLAFARAPGPPTVARLQTALRTALDTPADAVVSDDPSLVAGAVLRVGDRVLDASVKGQVEVLRSRARALLDRPAAVRA